jgi:hypothetical protein
MKNGNGIIFELVKVLFRPVVVLVMFVLFEGFSESIQVPLDAWVPFGQDAKQFP